MLKQKPFRNSSEFKQWDYCPRQWYLRRTLGKKHGTSAAARRGIDHHQKISKGVKEVQFAQGLFKAALIAGGVICLLLLVSRF